MSRSCAILIAWSFVAAAMLPLVGCQEAPAPAATSAAISKEAGPKQGAAKDPAPKDQASKDNAAKDPAPVKSAPQDAPKAKDAPAASQSAAKLPRLDITFDTIKLDMKKEDPFKKSLITPKIHELEGRKVKLRGYLLPSFQQTGLTQFVLVRDNMECCFGPGAALYDCVVVEMQPGRSTDFTIRPVAVEGVFAVREMLDPDGKPLAIYHLDGEAVR
jgi:hypothetical protein